MSMIEQEDILCYEVGQETVCEKCINNVEEKEVVEEDIITRDWVENQEKLIFCDRCKARIW